MPLYEYECDACGRRFEVIQKFSDPAPEACKHCGKGPVQRLASSPAIQFKGTGWYVTDYAQKGKSDASSTTPSGKTADGGSSDSASSSPAESSAGKGDATKDAGRSDSAKSDGGKSDGAKDGAKESAKASAKSDSPAPSSQPSTGGSKESKE